MYIMFSLDSPTINCKTINKYNKFNDATCNYYCEHEGENPVCAQSIADEELRWFPNECSMMEYNCLFPTDGKFIGDANFQIF